LVIFDFSLQHGSGNRVGHCYDGEADMTATSTKPRSRLAALEAVRGIAALIVVFHHLAHSFWPQALQSHSPWRSLLDGSFAVAIFFVLSGVVLSIAFFERPSAEALADAAIRRYFRLTLPVLTSVVLGYLLLRSGSFANLAAAETMGRDSEHWLSHFYTFRPSLGEALKEGTYRVYLDYRSSHSYNTVLWTMGVELYGSLFVFGFLSLFGGLRRRWLAYCLVAVILHAHWPYTMNFLVGLALCDCYVRARRSQPNLEFGAVAGTIAMVGGVFVGSGLPGWFGDWVGSNSLLARRLECQCVGAVLIVAAALFSPIWKRLLEFSWFSWLGRVSFALYLLHQLVICSLGSRVFLLLRHQCGYQAAALTSAGLVIIVSLLAAWAMTETIDRWSIALGRRASEFFRMPNGGDRERRKTDYVFRSPVWNVSMLPALRALFKY
jgi:peptidoglycan/LPS O-acetylase OafA/YrhL